MYSVNDAGILRLAAGAHLMLPALNAGATDLRTAFQCSSVWPVNRLVPPRNCRAGTQTHVTHPCIVLCHSSIKWSCKMFFKTLSKTPVEQSLIACCDCPF